MSHLENFLNASFDGTLFVAEKFYFENRSMGVLYTIVFNMDGTDLQLPPRAGEM